MLFNANFIDYSIIVDLLARHNCDVNQQNKEKMTAVMIAAQKGWASVIQTLLLAGKYLCTGQITPCGEYTLVRQLLVVNIH